MEVRPFVNGFAAARKPTGGWGFINEDGNVVVPPRFEEVSDLTASDRFVPAKPDPSALLAFARIDTAWTLVDGTGKAITDKSFKAVEGGMRLPLPAQTDAGVGYIDLEGNWALPPQFEVARPFTNLYAAVKAKGDNGKWGFIDGFGRYAISARFDSATPFVGDVAVVEQDGRWGVIDLKANWVVQNRYYGFVGWFSGFPVLIDALNRGWYVDRNGDQFLLFGLDPLEGKVGGKKLLKVIIKSNPPGAKVYFVPMFEWENEQKILLGELQARRRWIINEETTGPTGVVKHDAFNMTYQVIFEWPGQPQKLVSVEFKVRTNDQQVQGSLE
jgi:hypothetical protein